MAHDLRDDAQPGVLVSHRDRPRGRLLVRPAYFRGRYTALKVAFETEGGIALAELLATSTEVQVITMADGERRPGTLWFYGEGGEELAFRMDGALSALAQPGAREAPRKGPGGPHGSE